MAMELLDKKKKLNFIELEENKMTGVICDNCKKENCKWRNRIEILKCDMVEAIK